MKTLIGLTLGLAACVLADSQSLTAADTWSSASIGPRVSGVSSAGGHGSWIHSNSHVSSGLAVGNAVATDRNSMSFSYSSAIQGGCRGLRGQSLNITVGPGVGSTAATQVAGRCLIEVGGQTAPNHANAWGRGIGSEAFESRSIAINQGLSSPLPIRP